MMGSWGGMGAGYRVYEGGMRGVYVRGKGKVWGGYKGEYGSCVSRLPPAVVRCVRPEDEEEEERR